MKVGRKIAALAIAVTMVLAFWPGAGMTSFADGGTGEVTPGVETSGNCGPYVNGAPSDAVKYSFKDGTLTITGTGPMQDFNATPWDAIKPQISKIVVGEGVTSIGQNAFKDAGFTESHWTDTDGDGYDDKFVEEANLVNSIDISSTVTKIGNDAFANLRSIHEINLPASLISIGESAFQNCDSLTEFAIPDSVTSIDSYAFYSCDNLTSVNIPSGLTSISSGCFSQDQKLTSINIPEGIEEIEDNAFSRTGIASVIIPASVKRVSYSAFGNNNTLKTVVVRSSTTEFYRSFENSKNVILYGSAGSKAEEFAKSANIPFVASEPVLIPLNGITLNQVEAIIDKGSSVTLDVTYNPENTTDGTAVAWISSNTDVATVNDGVVHARAVGTTDITARVGRHTAVCHVTVKDKQTVNPSHGGSSSGGNTSWGGGSSSGGTSSGSGSTSGSGSSAGTGNTSSSTTAQPTVEAKSDTATTAVKTAENASEAVKAAADAVSAALNSTSTETATKIVDGAGWDASVSGAIDNAKSLPEVRAFEEAHANENVTINVKPRIEVEVKEASDGKISYEITPKFDVEVSAGSEKKTIKTDQKLVVKQPVTVNIPLPAGMATEGQVLYITHKMVGGTVKYYKGTVHNNVLSFINPDGFSEFIVTTEKPEGYKEEGEVTVYRLYDKSRGEHVYTTNSSERDFLVKAGWRYEGVSFTTAAEGASVYRLYNKSNGGMHFYTTSAGERDSLVKAGWKYEGVSFASAGTVPVYRVYNPNSKNGEHHYTANVAEYEMLGKIGWKKEGIAWYSFK